MERLRPHHLFCIQGYNGKGYNEAFCENMERIAKTLRRSPQRPVKVVFGPDSICGCCPHLKGGLCTWDLAGEEAVREHDLALARAFDLVDGAETSIEAINQRLASDPSARRVVKRYCSTCPWFEDCLFARGL